MSECHPVAQTIMRVDGPVEVHVVGEDGVTRIEATTKPGLHCDLPYLRVWAGDVAIAEYCQHHVLAVHFAG